MRRRWYEYVWFQERFRYLLPEKVQNQFRKSHPHPGQQLHRVDLYFHDPKYTNEDKRLLRQLGELSGPAFGVPKIHIVDASWMVQGGYLKVDWNTLVYSPRPELPVRKIVMQRSEPAACIWSGKVQLVEGSTPATGVDALRDLYTKHDHNGKPPHTMGEEDARIFLHI
ncbi:hypothetical protein B0T24DRAFT_609653 [Lasiosphaeria ovina]|uniref:Uncharacterized protein n=1 Tax=Lasiosphaeria ovina TaxID=92902 RepID=A0AAE0KL03_9PEZI|nr:hypothetical protein B0T24DRAFT_609653 [Lasiosphaeria ovina]